MGFPSYASSTGQGESDEPAWLAMPSELKQQLQEYVAEYDHPRDGELDGPCVWFDQDKLICKHHQHRPNVCRDFQVGGSDCIGWREHYQDRLSP